MIAFDLTLAEFEAQDVDWRLYHCRTLVVSPQHFDGFIAGIYVEFNKKIYQCFATVLAVHAYCGKPGCIHAEYQPGDEIAIRPVSWTATLPLPDGREVCVMHDRVPLAIVNRPRIHIKGEMDAPSGPAMRPLILAM